MKILALLAGALALAGIGGVGALAAAPNSSNAIVVAQGDDEGPGDEGMGDEGPGDEGPGDEGPGAGPGDDTSDNPDVVPDSADMDAAEAEVRQQMRNARVQIMRRGGRLIVNMGADILFSFDSYDVSNEGTAAAQALSRFMQNRRRATVEINGHTDTRGSHAYNETLSANRARAVADIMVEAGVDPSRIRATGYGETRPAVQTGDEVKEIRNRRVEVVINPGRRGGGRHGPRRHRRHGG